MSWRTFFPGEEDQRVSARAEVLRVHEEKWPTFFLMGSLFLTPLNEGCSGLSNLFGPAA